DDAAEDVDVVARPAGVRGDAVVVLRADDNEVGPRRAGHGGGQGGRGEEGGFEHVFHDGFQKAGSVMGAVTCEHHSSSRLRVTRPDSTGSVRLPGFWVSRNRPKPCHWPAPPPLRMT